MLQDLSILKGIHPGLVLEMELKHRKLSKRPFALSINEHPQTLGAITKGKRSMNTALALKIEHALGLEEGYFMMLQVYYEIKEEKRKQHIDIHPDLSKLRPILFWDTKIETIDWQQMKRAVIQRVFERGNETEKAEIIRFYGRDIVEKYLQKQN
ncbi:helix-turn-helix transcriptional regulator [Chitinophaga qingshengii]|uniref:Helix-turn-helix domain-containing protein n=1 Tax=Chitinophaga qingshengii TaxID=1569794 RepID=A0ABR7TMJ2_9BACT|nr:helix-turn-helix domain-containing protein [Chitinophaga qingshengii]MBC9931215.1 helix-turn-helix domain-containing protein [Chitinophaga qingshengii]